jgi:hypothetical protein
MLLADVELLRNSVGGLCINQAVVEKIANFAASDSHAVEPAGQSAGEIDPARGAVAVVGKERRVAGRAGFPSAAWGAFRRWAFCVPTPLRRPKDQHENSNDHHRQQDAGGDGAGFHVAVLRTAGYGYAIRGDADYSAIFPSGWLFGDGIGILGTMPITTLQCGSAMRAIWLAPALVVSAAGDVTAEPAKPLPTPQEMAAAREDVWGEAAIRHPDGPSYEFFKDLLPPLRYANTAFRHYPIVLCSPLSPVKARFISNGSGINLRADKPPMWKEPGTPVAFFVGDKPEPFGAEFERLTGPHYADGYLPVVNLRYVPNSVVYWQEAFAPVRGPLVEHGAVFVRFGGRLLVRPVVARIGAGDKFTAKDGAILDQKGNAVVQYGPGWTWDAEKSELTAKVGNGINAALIVFTKPIAQPPKEFPSFEEERKACVEAWNSLVARGASFDIPEPIVQSAWRSLVVGNYLVASGDRMNYSAGNAYDHLYEGECGDAVRSLMLFGHAADARKMVGPLMDFNRQATRFHVAGHKLQLLAHYYWVTRDKQYLRENRARWEPVIAFIRESAKAENGLLPKDRYAGDIAEQVYSLNSNAACWRGLRDMAAVLDDLGEKDRAAELRTEAAEFRKVILDAVVKSEDKAAKFIPISLLANEKPHDPLTATRTGSYYDLMIPYVLGSGILGDERDGWVINYLRQHGGIAMGLIRSMPHQGEFNEQPGVNVLYGLRYNLTLLRRGDRDHALVGFYGHLAQAMTRDTFIGGEGSRFLHGDKHGRSFYLPPNSASNATFLTTLRYLLIQDWDLDDDGRPETLRLLDAIPPRWLRDGAVIAIEKAPSAFGEISFRVESKLKDGEVVVNVQSPPRAVGRWLLRIPNPPGYQVANASIDNQKLIRDADGRVDLTGRSGKFAVRFQVKRQ